ncbi:hypothetical protein [Haploplasma axanthum]|uniref:Uncharacterized protein n=1 Tax=Haploplasma axanthum TaxID=29552 RepID=A0A449BEZ3_HAPAX|nr:hypothetical protein [Haploplasma axanthum]VEU80995.1 Uncharacterised protein [Haploplasma axanthum]
MHKNISINKYEYSLRRVDELNEVLLEKERELKNTQGFINRFKLNLEVKRLYKQISEYGSEVLEYEYNKANKIFN